MISKKTHPMIGRLSELLVSSGGGNHRAGFLDVATSPRSPLEYRILSPRGIKNYDVGGIGLGIVAGLEKSSNFHSGGHEILAKYAICSSIVNRSNPIPVNSVKNGAKEMDMESLEDYTYATSHGPDNKSFTRVYHHHGSCEHRKREQERIGFFTMAKESPSPARFSDHVASYPTSDFLSSCHLCKKKLHGKDIYMYRGEKAFCSIECRSRQIMIDERKEQCRSEVSRSADVASSPSTTSPIFSTGILAI